MHKARSDRHGWPDTDNLLGERPGDRLIRLTPKKPDIGGTSDLAALLADGWSITAREAVRRSDGSPGFAVQFTLQRGAEQALVLFTDMARIPCFTPGTAILTHAGSRAVEDLRPGDFVPTRDNGLQPIRWVGRRDIDAELLSARPHWAPILIRKDALGQGHPDRDIRVSPNHRMLVTCIRPGDDTAAPQEVLIAARHLTCLPGITVDPVAALCYVHVLFDRHEVILANGCWSESFQPNAQSLLGLERADRQQLLTLHPELAEQPRLPEYMSARPCLGRNEAAAVLRKAA